MVKPKISKLKFGKKGDILIFDERGVPLTFATEEQLDKYLKKRKTKKKMRRVS